jgi:WD40 repeat protein
VRLDNATLDRARLAGALLLATRALGARGTFDRTSGHFAASAAWEVDTRALGPVPPGADCRAVAFSPGGHLLATGHDDGLVRLWDAERAVLLRVLEGHFGRVRSVAWSPDGTRLASGSSDNTVRLWSVATGNSLAVLRGHLGPVTSVSWSRDGRFLASSGYDGTLRVWEPSTGHCLAVYVATPTGAVVYRPSDGRYRIQGDPAGRVAYTFGLARYELGELDEFVDGGLRLSDDEPLLRL